MGWPQDAFVGQKVVCISVSENNLANLIINDVYTIAKIGLIKDDVGFNLIELPMPKGALYMLGCDAMFLASRFKPLTEQTTETGMKILRSLLNEVKQHDPAH